jgi:hypothetical protein
VPIERIRIQGVRGIRRELTLDLKGSSLVLRGDNGTGKSSVVAGLLWALRGEEAPVPGAKADSEEAYRAHVLDGAASSQVILDLSGNAGSITVTATGLQVQGVGQQLRESCVRSSPFLLRKQLLRFLDDRPVDRFKYLEAFLDLGQADETREALQGRCRNHEAAAEDHKKTRDSHLQAVVALLPRELSPKSISWTSVVSALAVWSQRLKVPLDGSSWGDLVGLLVKLTPLLQGENLARKRLALQESVAAWANVGPSPEDPAPLVEKVAVLLQSATDASLSTLLDEAAKHFAAHQDTTACPVCQQAIEAERIAGEIQKRLVDLRELRAGQRAVAMSASSWQAYWSRITAAVHSYLKVHGLLALSDDPDSPSAPPGVESLSSKLAVDAWPNEIVRIGSLAVSKWVGDLREHAAKWLAQELKALPEEDNTDGIRRLVQAIELAQKVELPVAIAEAGAADEGERAAGFKLLAESIRTARQDIAQELLTEISSLVGEFYGFIHPPEADDEVTGAPAIEVQRRSGGTAHVRGTFHAKAVDDPRWVYSDGHLDTVGICVFLALRRFRADRDKLLDPKLMILDDIVLSVDLGHGRRLLDLLKAKFSDHQVLILTHNGLFCDWCAQRLPTYKRKAIARWTLETGPQLGEYLSTIEHIEQQVTSATSPKLLAQAVMNLMDEWLAEARFAYSLPVQAKLGEEYTLTEIWEPFCSRLKDVEKAMKTPLGRMKPLLEELGDLPKMRNRLAAHENEFAKEYPLRSIQETAKRAIELVRTLYCAECTKFAVGVPSPKEPEIVRCGPKCERIRYVRPGRQGAAPPTS